MDFSFSDDQQMFRSAARSFLDERCASTAVRALWEEPRGESEAMWKDMAQLGWLGLALPEEHGGSALGMVETAILLEEMGRAACPGPYFPTVLAALAVADAGTAAQKSRWLPAIATGAARATVALADGHGDWNPASLTTRAERAGSGWRLSGVKPCVPWAHVADLVLVPARTSDGVGVFLLEPGTSGVRLAPHAAMDPGTRWVTVTLDGVTVAAEAVLGGAGAGEDVVGATLRRGAVGAAAEMLGAARRCLDMSVDYARVREQFGQPIGSFQAIRHACADMLVDVENAHAATYYAAWAQDAGAEDAALAASVAKAYVGDAARRVCGQALQVHGGIGFTWEYDLHLYFKRAKALETMYGDADYHRELIVGRVAG
jgi:alkylation response protein AidB-like acyl-CoA dehydrogenase